MDQGTGKSRVFLNRCAQLYESGLITGANIIAPKQLMHQWSGEVLEEHWPYDYAVFVWSGFNTKKESILYSKFLSSNKFKFLVLNYDIFQGTGLKRLKKDSDLMQALKKLKAYPIVKRFFETTKVITCLDESTKIKNPIASQTRALLSLYSNQAYKAILTGTPTPNSPLDAYSQLEFLKPGFWGMPYFIFEKMYTIKIKMRDANTNRIINIPISEKAWSIVKSAWEKYSSQKVLAITDHDYDWFAEEYGVSVKDLKIILASDTYQPYKNMQQLKDKMATVTFFLKKEDAGLDLPEKIYETVTAELTGEQKRLLKELKANWITELSGKQLTVSNTLSIISRIQLIRSGFFPYENFETDIEGNEKKYFEIEPLKENPAVTALLDDISLYTFDTPVIIWANFTCELNAIYQALRVHKYGVELLNGQTSEKRRKEIESAFKSGSVPFLVVNPAIGEYGFNFQVCSMQYFFSNTYKADRRAQAEDRSHRIGQRRNVLYKDIIIEKTLDKDIQNVLKRKLDVIDFFKTRDVESVLSCI